jgi:hypothetical protein
MKLIIDFNTSGDTPAWSHSNSETGEKEDTFELVIGGKVCICLRVYTPSKAQPATSFWWFENGLESDQINTEEAKQRLFAWKAPDIEQPKIEVLMNGVPADYWGNPCLTNHTDTPEQAVNLPYE